MLNLIVDLKQKEVAFRGQVRAFKANNQQATLTEF